MESNTFQSNYFIWKSNGIIKMMIKPSNTDLKNQYNVTKRSKTSHLSIKQISTWICNFRDDLLTETQFYFGVCYWMLASNCQICWIFQLTITLFTCLHIVYLCILTVWQFINTVCCCKVLFSGVGGMTQNKNSCILIKHQKAQIRCNPSNSVGSNKHRPHTKYSYS